MKPPYDRIDQAFEHLVKEDSYPPYEVRDEGDYVVVFFPQTLSVRLFKTLENVGRLYNWSVYRHDVYVKPEQLAAKFTTVKLVEFCERANLDQLEGLTALELAQRLWSWCQETGDLATKFDGRTKGLEEDKYLIRVDLLKEMTEEIAKLPKQARIIATAFAEAEKTTYSEDELTTFAVNLAVSGKLKTKQDARRVVDYYRGALADLGVMTYSSRRERKEEDSDNDSEDSADLAA